MNALSYVRMVLWSFFGIRRRAAASDELSQAKLLVLVGVALCMAGLFGLVLWALANVAVRFVGSAALGT